MKDYQPHTMPFIDNITVGGPKIDYRGEEALLGVRRFVLEYIMQLNDVLTNIKRANATVSSKKCYQDIDYLVVVGYKVRREGRYPNQIKVEKIVRQLLY